ncbi:MAG: hypothetical protein E7378_01025 [Clostridiales bacterium]|nr:hypothetical protein [Clostridiales bacterium]
MMEEKKLPDIIIEPQDVTELQPDTQTETKTEITPATTPENATDVQTDKPVETQVEDQPESPTEKQNETTNEEHPSVIVEVPNETPVDAQTDTQAEAQTGTQAEVITDTHDETQPQTHESESHSETTPPKAQTAVSTPKKQPSEPIIIEHSSSKNSKTKGDARVTVERAERIVVEGDPATASELLKLVKQPTTTKKKTSTKKTSSAKKSSTKKPKTVAPIEPIQHAEPAPAETQKVEPQTTPNPDTSTKQTPASNGGAGNNDEKEKPQVPIISGTVSGLTAIVFGLIMLAGFVNPLMIIITLVAMSASATSFTFGSIQMKDAKTAPKKTANKQAEKQSKQQKKQEKKAEKQMTKQERKARKQQKSKTPELMATTLGDAIPAQSEHPSQDQTPLAPQVDKQEGLLKSSVEELNKMFGQFTQNPPKTPDEMTAFRQDVATLAQGIYDQGIDTSASEQDARLFQCCVNYLNANNALQTIKQTPTGVAEQDEQSIRDALAVSYEALSELQSASQQYTQETIAKQAPTTQETTTSSSQPSQEQEKTL